VLWWLCICAAFAASGVIGVSPAKAATTSCSSFTSSGIVFSPYDTVTKAAVDGVGSFTFTCTGTGTDTLNITIYGGNAGTCTNRQMKNGTSILIYNLFKEVGRTTNWCDGASRLNITMDYSTAATQTKTIPVYGRVSINQNPPFGSYTDTLSAQLKQGGGVMRSGSLSISGSVSPICSVSAGSLGFGSYTSAAAALATATVSVNCSNGGSYAVGLGSGSNFSTTRRMAGPSGQFLGYELYSDSGRSVFWGDGTTLGNRVSGTGSGVSQNLTVYGRIPAGQNITPGSYTDTVVVTVEY
jgi:spore coat protein U-like protein